MKHINKILAVLLALALVLTMGAVAFAAEGQEATATPTPAPTPKAGVTGSGSLTIGNAESGKSYRIFRVFDASVDTTRGTTDSATGVTTYPTAYSIDKSKNEKLYNAVVASKLFVLDETAPNVFQLSRAMVEKETEDGKVKEPVSDSAILAWVESLDPLALGLDSYSATASGDRAVFSTIP